MRGEPWTEMELQELYEAVNDVDWFDEVRPFLPNRTEGAIRGKMCLLRAEVGIIPHRAGPRPKWRLLAEREKAKFGSDRLLKAILEAA